MLADDQLRDFGRDGYVLLPGVVGEELLAAAEAELDAAVAEAPPAAGTTGPHFVFRAPALLPAADAALRASGALAAAEELVAPHRVDHALDHIQLALNLPPHPQAPGAPHIDGHRPGEAVASFTMLAAIFLTDESAEGRGNLWVWPGSHLGHERLFRERGTDALVEVGGHACFLDPPVFFGRGEPLLARRGDLLLAHYLLGHNTGANTGDEVRRVLYYRLACEGHAERRAATFLDALHEYRAVAAALAAA